MLNNTLNLQCYQSRVIFPCMDIDALIGKNLRRIRQLKNLSQDDLTQLTNISKALISDAENNKRGIGKDVMMRICKALNVQPYEFYIDDSTPLPATELEKKALYMARSAENSKLDYIAEEIVEYGNQRIERVKKDQKKAGVDKGRAVKYKAGSG